MMSNEEKILSELAAIRAELATVSAAVEKLNGRDEQRRSEPTSEQQLEAFRDLINSISDEDAAEFGKLVGEMEQQKGGVL